jgi:hypothetical protein
MLPAILSFMAIKNLPRKAITHLTTEEHDQYKLNAAARELSLDEYIRLVLAGLIDEYPIKRPNPYAE